MAACSGAAGGLALLSIRSARSRPAGEERGERNEGLPAHPATADGQGALEAEVARLGARIAVLDEALRECGRQAGERLRSQQIAAMESRADLAGAIVHDMNNALGAVAGYADFLVCDLPAGSPQADYAGRVVAAVDRARSGLRRLVAEARTEPVHLKPERAATVLDEAATFLRMVPAVPGSLSLRHDAGTPTPICNAGQLARTLAGLAAEILAATGRGGEARLCLRASCPAGTEDPDADAASAGWTVRPLLTPHAGPQTLFELRVDGPPLADEALAALVDPLLSARACYRDGQTAGKEDAHWPAALQTARRHDGGLSLLTHPAEGTVVRLHIPAVSPSPAASFPHGAPSLGRHPVAPTYKILVVDADPASGDRFQAGLERQGFEVSVCEDVRDALDVVTDEPDFFDAVVIGPGLSALPAGQALAHRLKALRADLPCVLYAEAEPGPGGAMAGAGDPADLMLPLPVDLPRLARGVAALAAGGVRQVDGAGERR
jgi:CheY-like chemotaxis protein